MSGIGPLLATLVLATTLAFSPVALAHEGENGEYHHEGRGNHGESAIIDWGAPWLPPAFAAFGLVAFGTVSYVALRRGS